MRKNILSKLNFDRTAFTLIEISVAIAIVGIIAALIIVGTSGTRNSAYDAKRKGDVEMLEKTILTYQAYVGSVPVSATTCDLKQDGTGCSFTSNFTPTYITTIPTDPTNSSVYYRYSSTDGSAFVIESRLSDGTYYSCSSVGNKCTLLGRNMLSLNQSNGTEDGTTTGFAAVNATATSDSTIKYAGNRSLKGVCSGPSTDCYAAIGGDTGGIMWLGMVAGRTYTVQARIYVPAVTGLGGGRRIWAYYYTGSYTQVSSNTATQTDTWQLLTLTFTIPSNATRAFIRLYGNNTVDAAKPVYWDNIQLEEAGSATTWVVGR